MGALHPNGTTERHQRDACEGCATRDTRLAELAAELLMVRGHAAAAADLLAAIRRD